MICSRQTAPRAPVQYEGEAGVPAGYQNLPGRNPHRDRILRAHSGSFLTLSDNDIIFPVEHCIKRYIRFRV